MTLIVSLMKGIGEPFRPWVLGLEKWRPAVKPAFTSRWWESGRRPRRTQMPRRVKFMKRRSFPVRIVVPPRWVGRKTVRF